MAILGAAGVEKRNSKPLGSEIAELPGLTGMAPRTVKGLSDFPASGMVRTRFICLQTAITSLGRSRNDLHRRDGHGSFLL